MHLLLVLALCQLIAALPQPEIQAIKDLKAACPLLDWPKDSNFSTICTQSVGIKCSAKNHNVINISFSEIFRTLGKKSVTVPGSTLPASINNLTKLVHLDVSACYFKGVVPKLTSLVELTYISIANNSFTEASIPNLAVQVIKAVDFRNNHINGDLPTLFAKFLTKKNMTTIIGRGNGQLVGTLPSFLGQFLDLQLFDFTATSLSGSIPSDYLYMLSRGNARFKLRGTTVNCSTPLGVVPAGVLDCTPPPPKAPDFVPGLVPGSEMAGSPVPVAAIPVPQAPIVPPTAVNPASVAPYPVPPITPPTALPTSVPNPFVMPPVPPIVPPTAVPTWLPVPYDGGPIPPYPSQANPVPVAPYPVPPITPPSAVPTAPVPHPEIAGGPIPGFPWPQPVAVPQPAWPPIPGSGALPPPPSPNPPVPVPYTYTPVVPPTTVPTWPPVPYDGGPIPPYPSQGNPVPVAPYPVPPIVPPTAVPTAPPHPEEFGAPPAPPGTVHVPPVPQPPSPPGVIVVHPTTERTVEGPYYSDLWNLGTMLIPSHLSVVGNLRLGRESLTVMNGTVDVVGCVEFDGVLVLSGPGPQQPFHYTCHSGQFSTIETPGIDPKCRPKPDYGTNVLSVSVDPNCSEEAQEPGNPMIPIIIGVAAGVFVFLIVLAIFGVIFFKDRLFPYRKVEVP